MNEQEKQSVRDFATNFWNWEPQPCFPEMVAEFAERGIDIRCYPRKEARDAALSGMHQCEYCGRPSLLTRMHMVVQPEPTT